jgi:hypothetical protein
MRYQSGRILPGVSSVTFLFVFCCPTVARSQPTTNIGGDNGAMVVWTAVIGIVSILAFFRPELTLAFRSLFKPRRLLIEPSGRMEVNYSYNWGSHIALKGTLESVNRASFVRNLYVKLARDGTDLGLVLNQFMFRVPIMESQGARNITYRTEVARAFKIDADETDDYYVTFIDRATFAQIGKEGTQLQTSWNAFSQPRMVEFARTVAPRPQDPAGGMLWDRASSEFVESSCKEFIATNFATLRESWLKRFIWEPGTYTVTLFCVVREGSSLPFSESWSFNITESESHALRANIDKMLMGACGLNVPESYCLFKWYDSEATAV